MTTERIIGFVALLILISWVWMLGYFYGHWRGRKEGVRLAERRAEIEKEWAVYDEENRRPVRDQAQHHPNWKQAP